MTINDKVFGELAYEDVWVGELKLNFLGKEVAVDLYNRSDF